MKWFYTLLAFVVMIMSLTGLYFSFKVYYSTSSIVSAYASGNGEINLTVEVAPSGGGGGSGGGAGGGGGGGGDGTAPLGTPNFEPSVENFNLQIVSGERDTKEFIIKNTGKRALTIKVSATGLENYITFNTDKIVLKVGESAPLTFTVTAPEPGVYAGKIVLTYGSIIKEVLVLLNVVSEGVLFDVTVTIPELYRDLRLGQRLPVLIELTEVGAETGVDVTMKYVIKDFDGITFYTDSETFYVLGTKSYSKKFSTVGLNPGDYILGVELTYPGGVATSSSHFRVSETVLTLQTWLAVGAFFVAVLVVVVSIIFYKRHKTQQIIIKKPIRSKKI
ncbi:MAG: hypothetical protein AABY16_03000 [Nanoarchaeota archaeon]